MRCRPVEIERGEPIRQRQLDRADVDAELERGGRDHDAQVAFLQPLLGAVAALARQAAVVGGDGLGAQPLAQVQRHALDQAARVDEHQRRLVLARQRGDPIVELGPLLVGAHRAQLVLRHLTARSRSRRWPTSTMSGSGRSAHEQARRDLERPHRRRQPDPLQLSPGATSASSRSSDSARWAPRLSAATAWISSTITVRTSRSARRPDSDVSRMNSDSGVVTRTCGGCRAAARRSRAVVSPVRTAVRTPGAG